MEKNTKDTHNPEVKISTIIYSALIAIAGIVIVLGVLIYFFDWNNNFIKKAEKIIPYPIAIINNSGAISLADLNSNLESVRKFYENQDFSEANMRVDFSTADGKKRLKIKEKEILNKMIENKAIEIIARKKGIVISTEMVDQNVNRKLDEYGTGDSVKSNLDRLYGWTLQDFKDKVVKPDLYSQELEKIFAKEDDSSANAKIQIEKAKAELDKKKDFAEVAKAYSKGSTAESGGELGWFKKDQLIPDIADAVFSLDKGKRSDILESSLGFHIVEVEDKKSENGADLVKIRQIFSPKKVFAEFLSEEMKKMKISIFGKNYYWDQNNITAQFRDEGMRNFEKNLIDSSQGNASSIFNN